MEWVQFGLPDIASLAGPNSLFSIPPFIAFVTESPFQIVIESTHDLTLNYIHDYISRHVMANELEGVRRFAGSR